MNTFYTSLAEWNRSVDRFTKVQAAYGVLTVALFTIAAFISLVNQALGQAIVFYACIAGLTFIANGVVAALVNTFVTPRLQVAQKKSKK